MKVSWERSKIRSIWSPAISYSQFIFELASLLQAFGKQPCSRALTMYFAKKFSIFKCSVLARGDR